MNAFLITIDSLRADAVGHAASSDVNTPNLDSFAEQAIRCSNAFANAPYTVASFPAILTGTYPWMYGGYSSISPDRPFMAERFRAQGYTTAGFHSNPYLDARFNYDRGFSTFYDSDHWTTGYSKLQQRIKELLPKKSFAYRLLREAKTFAERLTGDKIGLPYLPASQLTDEVVSWLSRTEEPGFGWVHYMDIHNPYLPHDGCRGGGIEHQRALELHHRMIEAPDDLTSVDIEDLRELYLGGVEYLDQHIGRLLNEIGDWWGLDDTIIVIVSDHGDGFGEWGYYSHVVDEFHDDLLRIPLLVHLPSTTGNEIDGPVTTVDIAPTMLGEVEIPIPDACVGRRLTVETSIPSDRCVFAHAGERHDGKAMVGDLSWRLVREVATNEELLYHRDGDYSEVTVPVSEHPEEVSRLGAALDDHLEMIDRQQTSTPEAEISSDVQDRLERLGYK